jgi:hypothetical protein
MADPTSTQLVSANSTTATTTVNFSAQSAGTLLTLHVMSDDYKTGDPSGWTVAESIGPDETAYHGGYFWWKIASGAETSVDYVIGSATASSHVLLAHTNIEGTASKDVSAKQYVTSGASTYTTPTSPTTSAGRRYGIAQIGGQKTTPAFTSIGTWINSYAEIGERTSTTTNPAYTLGIAGLAFDGGGTTSSGATYDPGDSVVARSGIIAVFKVSSAAPTKVSRSMLIGIG